MVRVQIHTIVSTSTPNQKNTNVTFWNFLLSRADTLMHTSLKKSVFPGDVEVAEHLQNHQKQVSGIDSRKNQMLEGKIKLLV